MAVISLEFPTLYATQSEHGKCQPAFQYLLINVRVGDAIAYLPKN
ncbi:MAG TPA: hypothetical protein V6D15_13840 [Oculatellaceae cyanobacterium]